MLDMSEATEDDACSEASLKSSVSELERTLEILALNRAPPRQSRHSLSSQPNRPPPAVAWLIGTWKGKGKGIYPTIRDFEYMEECTFDWDANNPRPVLFYRQKTYSTKGHPPRPMHAESGYVRVIAPAGSATKRIEFVITAPNGVCTVEEGTVDGYTIKTKLMSTARSSTARAPHCTDLERTYTVDTTQDPPTLHYVVDMATTNTPILTRHLEAMMTKWSEDELSSPDITATSPE